ncbi:MAG TPA: helix-turn-helix transcriptional regulator [Candidatus Paenalcaligenes intestinipullorum]|uniref:Helix-turn-helix transcriptional regulator n=1 Tax=Candidatus Paenalcaligenes intestinipullorum TaxID=2838718 RepID=A0A9D2U9M8_9BURK|nr:helix-turn-helix transcriptional regulator [Candidatus Paenalcaligenes intestinipullorum]
MSLNGQNCSLEIAPEWHGELPRPIVGSISSIANQAIARWHTHPWLQFSYALEGVVDVNTEQGRYMAPPQRAVLIPAGELHRVYASTNTLIRSMYIRTEALAESVDSCRVLSVSPLLRELIRRFSEYPVFYTETGPESRLAEVLLDEIQNASTSGLMLRWPRDARILGFCQHLYKEPSSNLSLETHAQHIGVSSKTLSRLFLQETGLNFRAWRQQLRLMQALPMLEAGQRVTDVALACGYESLSAFIAAFRLAMGVTPMEFAHTYRSSHHSG